jgi:hypothetical protein
MDPQKTKARYAPLGLCAQRASDDSGLWGPGSRLGSVRANEIVHRLTVPALDLEPLPGTECVLLDLLKQASAPRAAHLDPADLRGRMPFRLLAGEWMHGNLACRVGILQRTTVEL